MKPIPCRLGKGNDGNYYWIYYAGMGDYSFEPVQERWLPALESFAKTGELRQTDETATLPLYFEDHVRPATFILYDLVIEAEKL